MGGRAGKTHTKTFQNMVSFLAVPLPNFPRLVNAIHYGSLILAIMRPLISLTGHKAYEIASLPLCPFLVPTLQ